MTVNFSQRLFLYYWTIETSLVALFPLRHYCFPQVCGGSNVQYVVVNITRSMSFHIQLGISSVNSFIKANSMCRLQEVEVFGLAKSIFCSIIFTGFVGSICAIPVIEFLNTFFWSYFEVLFLLLCTFLKRTHSHLLLPISLPPFLAFQRAFRNNLQRNLK